MQNAGNIANNQNIGAQNLMNAGNCKLDLTKQH